MATVSVDSCLTELQDTIQKYQTLAADSQTFQLVHGRMSSHIGQRRVELIVGACALGIHLSWEDFVEATFIRYLCGAKTRNSFSPTLNSGRQKRIADALAMLLGTQQYLSWSIKSTLSRAQAHFLNGDPYQQSIAAIRGPLEDLIVVRNRFAHRSSFSQSEFRSLVRREYGYLPRGITPGRFLLSAPINKGFTYPNYLDYYSQFLLSAARLICP